MKTGTPIALNSIIRRALRESGNRGRSHGGTVDRPTRSILIADDSTAQRRMLALQLARRGYAVVEAADGIEALTLARERDFDIVLSDWMMPGLTGTEFCRAFRALPRESYGYFVLLTARSETADIADGLASGADDFLTKPVNSAELVARLLAGERILAMQAELRRRHRDLETLYAGLRRDLDEARDFQSSLMPDPLLNLGTATATFLMQPSGPLGGDLVGHFCLDDGHHAFWSLDVAGHGVAAAIFAARLAGLLSDRSRDQNLAFRDGRRLPPAQVVDRLNRLLCNDRKSDQYVTMLYAELCMASGQATLVQAGHPNPVLASGNETRVIGTGGFPVGLIADAKYAEVTLQLRAGDRLVIPSDGITECPVACGELGQDGLGRLLPCLSGLAGPPLRDRLLNSLATAAGTREFPDDVSAIILDWHGPSR